jgi:Domain of unknown function (DUF3805)
MKTSLFEIDLPNQNWQHECIEGIHDFYNLQEIEGVLQISSYFSATNRFDVEKDFIQEKKRRPSSKIITLASYKAIHYGENLADDLLRYSWITGFENTKLFITFTINSNQEVVVIDKNYVTIMNLLASLKINLSNPTNSKNASN